MTLGPFMFWLCLAVAYLLYLAVRPFAAKSKLGRAVLFFILLGVLCLITPLAWALISAAQLRHERQTELDRVKSASTSPSIVVWSSLPPTPNTYHHIEHLQKLLQEANTLIATNPAVFSQSQARGKLAESSPLRRLLGIPNGEQAYLTWWQSIAQRCVIVRSSKTEQRFGAIKVNLRTGLVDSAHDVEALFVISEMERRLRQTVGTREEALRLFGGGLHDSPSPEQEQATRALAAALFLPKDRKCYVRMSAPGGSNGGQGYLTVDVVSSSNSWDHVARVFYPIRHSLFSAFGLSRPSYRFGGLSLSAAWTNLNTAGFLTDSEGFPYPKP